MAFRELGADGRAERELVTVDPSAPGAVPRTWRPLQVEVMRGGSVVHRPSLAEVRAHHATALAELPGRALEIAHGEAAMSAAPAPPGEVQP